jgi:cyclophilin family peptidyl-prolyl cis-trans isomerase/HEAT repeat protein
VRRAAALALGRAAGGEGIAALARLLVDSAAPVRRAAAFALGCYEDRPAPDARELVAGRLGLETDTEALAALLVAAGRLGGVRAAGLRRSLAHTEVPVREAAALGAGRAAMHGATAQALIEPVASALTGEAAPSVRVALAFALSRLGGRPPPSALSDREARVRFFAATAWGKAGEKDRAPLRPLLQDDDWRVRVAALGALSRTGPDAAPDIAKGLKAAWLSLAASHESLQSKRAQVVLAGIDALGALAPRERKTLEEIHWAADGRESVIRYRKEALPTLDAVHCAAARALDVADGMPHRVGACGAPRVPGWVHRRLAAQVLARTRAPAAKRLALLTPLLRDPEPRVQTAAIDALETLSGERGARPLLLEALRSDDDGVVGGVADVIAAHSKPDGAIEEALLSAIGRRDLARDSEAMASLAKALGTTGSERCEPALRRLLESPVRAVVDAARASYAKRFLGRALPKVKRRPLTGFPAAAPPVEARATVRTTKGSFEVRLFAREAPVTVGNFIALARRGFYRNLFIHRVVPAFVVQLGDPRGDGNGGPGYTLPCELSPRRYRRGSVGMALAGRDTGGSQFFVTHTETPHLDGAYTLFGEVTAGMEIVESLVEGDRLLDVVVAGGSPASP